MLKLQMEQVVIGMGRRVKGDGGEGWLGSSLVDLCVSVGLSVFILSKS